jgi:tetratricopeptide (TPR) repeat protein
MVLYDIMKKKNADTYLELGLRQLQDDDYKRAVDLLSRAIDIDPYLADAYGFRGMAYFLRGNYQAALDDCNIALSLEPALENVYFFRALYFIQTKLYGEAIKDLSSAIEINKHFADAYYYRGICKGMLDDLKGGTFDIMAAAQLGMSEAQKILNEHNIVW